MSLDEKYHKLQQILINLDSAVVAFSGGVDSTLLLKVACDSLGSEKVLALTAISPIFPAYEIEQTQQLARDFGVRLQLIATDELALDTFVENSPQRCYHCKHHLFGLFLQEVRKVGFATLLDGSNLDDLNDYRPGKAALEQLNILSPLREAEFSKQDIRDLSQRLGLSTWNKQPFACLATRFPYGTKITAERLKQIDSCESWLRNNGFLNYRVRYHHSLARVEVAPDEIPRLLDEQLRLALVAAFKQNGFDYITLDLQGYRSGSMNEVLSQTTC
jgi:uncharacterized protein